VNGTESHDEYSLRDGTTGAALAGCHVELHLDRSVVLVVDGERLFRFDSIDALLSQYDVGKAELMLPTLHSASAELQAAELAAAAFIAAIHLRPRAEKSLADERVVDALERVRSARVRVATFSGPTP